MDPTGFAIGVIGLTQIVSTCIQTFQIIQSIRSYGHDAEIVMLKLDIERELFISWAHNAGLLQKHYVDASLFTPSRDRLIHAVLKKIKELLDEAENLARKYGMIQEDQWKSSFDCEKNVDERGWCHCSRHGRRHRHRDDGQSSRTSLSQSPPKNVSLPRKFMWTIHAKDEFQKLIDQLHGFIERLDQMVKSVDQRRTLMKDLRALGADFSKLDLIDNRLDGRDDGLSDLVSVFSDGESEGKPAAKARSRRESGLTGERKSRAAVSEVSRSSGESEKSERSGRTKASYLEVPQRRERRSSENHRRSGSYERPPSYSSLYNDRSSGSGRSSRSTFTDMMGEMVGSRPKGRSDLY